MTRPSVPALLSLVVLGLAPLSGCNRYELDSDGDGFTELTNDCDDSDPNVHPDAVEVCGNNKDDNCNGELDELGATSGRVWYADLDGDGYGTETYTVEACAKPEGYVERKWDCDEGNAAVNPGADETCDGEDNDCDDEVDEPTAVDAVTWYPDRDGDGFGDDALATVSCERPDGHVETPGDCNDVDPLTNPDRVEDCRTAGDDDCDGTPNGDIDDAVGCTPYFADLDGDGFAGSERCLCAPADPWLSEVEEDCDDTDSAVYPGAVATRRWGSEDCNDSTAVDLTTADNDLVDLVGSGRLPAVVGDRNDDGLADLLFLARADGPPAVVHGPLLEATAEDVELLYVPQAASLNGAGRMAWTPDLTGDGLAEIVSVQLGSEESQGVFLFDGDPTEGSTHADALATLTDRIPGGSTRPFANQDLDGDGVIEVVYGDEDYQPAFGVLDPSGTADGSDWNASLLGVEGPSATVPQAVFADVDGDGVDELLLGQMTRDINNRTLGMWGTVQGSVAIFEISEDRVFLPRVVYYGNKFLGSMSLAVADTNGDGHADLLAGDSANILEPNSWQILGFTGPLVLETTGVRAEVGWQADIRVSGGEDDRIGNFDLLPDLDGDGAAGLLAYSGAGRGPWYIRELTEGHHRISEVGRPLSPDTDDQMAGYARGVGDTNGDGSPDVVVGFFDGGYSLEPRLFLGDLR